MGTVTWKAQANSKLAMVEAKFYLAKRAFVQSQMGSAKNEAVPTSTGGAKSLREHLSALILEMETQPAKYTRFNELAWETTYVDTIPSLAVGEHLGTMQYVGRRNDNLAKTTC